jgi:pilus assembly protein CpaF
MSMLTAPSTSSGAVRRLARLVSETLAEERIDRASSGRLPLDLDDERELARTVIVRHLDVVAAEHLAQGFDLLDEAQESHLIDAVLAKVLGLGRIQPLLDDPEITDIHIRGAASTRVKLADGQRLQVPPVVDTDEELVELVRLVATRMGRSERRFDAGNPELNVQLPDGSRLFATMEVSARPSVIIRKHRFELSSLDELEERGLVDRCLREFLAAAVRAKRNIVICGGTGTGKTTMLRALLNEVPSDDRIVTIEDAYELGLDRFEG